jgi:thymidylate synthase ThyX
MKATLISWSRDPLVTLQVLWQASKTDMPLEDIIADAEHNVANHEVNAMEWFRGVMDQEIPVIENINFVFMCEDVPISWREQAVRHRVGVAYGDAFAVDIIPEMNGSFWSQSHRLKDMSSFVERGEVYTP